MEALSHPCNSLLVCAANPLGVILREIPNGGNIIVDLEGYAKKATEWPRVVLCEWKGDLVCWDCGFDLCTMTRYDGFGNQRDSLNLSTYSRRTRRELDPSVCAFPGRGISLPIMSLRLTPPRAVPLRDGTLGILVDDQFILVKEEKGAMVVVASWTCRIQEKMIPFGNGFVAIEDLYDDRSSKFREHRAATVHHWKYPRTGERTALDYDTRILSHVSRTPYVTEASLRTTVFADKQAYTVRGTELYEHAEDGGVRVFPRPVELRGEVVQEGTCLGYAFLTRASTEWTTRCQAYLYIGSGRVAECPDDRGSWAADGDRAYVFSDGGLTCYQARASADSLLNLCARATPFDHPEFECLPEELRDRVRAKRLGAKQFELGCTRRNATLRSGDQSVARVR